MSKHIIRNIRIFLLCNFPQTMNIRLNIAISMFLREMSQISFIMRCFSMTEMVISGHVIASVIQISCKFIIAVNIFHHPMANLNNCFYFTFRNPFLCMHSMFPICA